MPEEMKGSWCPLGWTLACSSPSLMTQSCDTQVFYVNQSNQPGTSVYQCKGVSARRWPPCSELPEVPGVKEQHSPMLLIYSFDLSFNRLVNWNALNANIKQGEAVAKRCIK